MKIKISRSYSEKKQFSQFEPVESSCFVEMEFEMEEPLLERIAIESEWLDIVCRTEVAKTLKKINPHLQDDPRIVEGNNLLSENDQKSLKRINSAKSPAQKKFFAKDEVQKGFDHDDKEYHSSKEIRGAREENERTFNPEHAEKARDATEQDADNLPIP